MSKFDSENSKKQLFLDVGNSSIKGAFKKGVDWEPVHPRQVKTARELIEWIAQHPQSFSEVVIAGVRNDVQQAILQQLQQVKVVEITNKDIPRELLDYKTPDTLGIDRFLVCYGATGQTREAVVVIDAGTATTIDFMDRDRVFHGGMIAPGLQAFTGILPEKAPALPKVDMEIPPEWPGKSTEDSLKWGQTGFYGFALDAAITRYENTFGDFEIFVTGGNGPVVQKMLSVDTKLRPYLIFDGMEELIQ